MNIAIIIAVTLLAFGLVFALYRLAVGTNGSGDSKPVIESLDVSAFNNLIDPSEEDFLRQELPPPVFRTIQRLRLRAALEYVSCASRNAAVLIRIGKSMGAESGNPHGEQASDLANAAVQLRFLSLLVLCLLWIKIAFPGLRLSLKGVSALHERLVAQQAALGRLQMSDHLLNSQ